MFASFSKIIHQFTVLILKLNNTQQIETAEHNLLCTSNIGTTYTFLKAKTNFGYCVFIIGEI